MRWTAPTAGVTMCQIAVAVTGRRAVHRITTGLWSSATGGTVRYVPIGRGGRASWPVQKNPANDRRPAAEASTDMTPRAIAAGLNQRGPGARRLPNDRFHAPGCTLTTWARMRHVASPSPQTGGHALDHCSIVLPTSVAGRSHLGIFGRVHRLPSEVRRPLLRGPHRAVERNSANVPPT